MPKVPKYPVKYVDHVYSVIKPIVQPIVTEIVCNHVKHHPDKEHVVKKPRPQTPAYAAPIYRTSTQINWTTYTHLSKGNK